MGRLFRIFLLFLVVGFAGPVHAEREVHVIAVGNGWQTDDYYALPEARVLVDRPGQEVALVLLDSGDLRWRVDATPGTFVTEILLGGPRTDASEVLFSGIPMRGARTSGLPLVYHPHGAAFRDLVQVLSDRLETPRLSSFRATHQAPQRAFVVDRVDTSTAGLAHDYLAGELGVSTDLPPALQRWLETGGRHSDISVSFDETGLSLVGPESTKHFPLPETVPRILLPATGVYDPVSQTGFGLTYGAEGYIYAVGTQTGEWSVVTGLDGYDAAGLLYDADAQLLITTGAFSRPGDIRVFDLDGAGQGTFIPITGFPGLSDLFDFGNEHGPPLIPRVHAQGWLLLEALAREEGRYPDSGDYRIYAVRLETGEVRLLRYRND